MSQHPALILPLLAGGIWVQIFFAKVIWRTLKTGTIDTKPGARPITKAARPAVYWSVTIWILTGGVVAGWGFVVIAFRFAHSY